MPKLRGCQINASHADRQQRTPPDRQPELTTAFPVGKQQAGGPPQNQTPQRCRFEDVMPPHDPHKPVGNVEQMQADDGTNHQKPTSIQSPQHAKNQNRADQQRQNVKRPEPTGKPAVEDVASGQFRCQVLCPPIVGVDHLRTQMLFATHHIVESVDVPGRVQIRVELIRRCQPSPSDGMVVSEHHGPADHQGQAKSQHGPQTLSEGSRKIRNWVQIRGIRLPNADQPDGDIQPKRQPHRSGRHRSAQHCECQSTTGDASVHRRACSSPTGHPQQEERQSQQSRVMSQQRIAKQGDAG